jgi:choice-of-anchor A domain-containing protein
MKPAYARASRLTLPLHMLVTMLLIVTAPATSIARAPHVASHSLQPAHNVTPPDTSGPLGFATDFDLFVLEDADLTAGVVGGRVAVGGDAAIDGGTIGALVPDPSNPDQIPDSHGHRDSLIVGGHLEFHTGRVAKGNISCGICEPQNIGDVFDAGSGNTWFETPPVGVDFAQAATVLTSLSTAIAQLSANGTVQDNQGVVTLTGTDRNLNIFSFDGAYLSQGTKTTQVVFDVPAGSNVIINVTGPSITWKVRDIELGNADPHHMLVNIPDATSVIAYGALVEGSVLAPFADVFTDGLVDGHVIAKNYVSDGIIRSRTFQGSVGAAASASTSQAAQTSPNQNARKLMQTNG